MNPQSFYDICKFAGISGYVQKKAIYNFVSTLINMEIIEEFSL